MGPITSSIGICPRTGFPTKLLFIFKPDLLRPSIFMSAIFPMKIPRSGRSLFPLFNCHGRRRTASHHHPSTRIQKSRGAIMKTATVCSSAKDLNVPPVTPFGKKAAKIGPDLTNLPHRDVASVLRDIREPNATINPDYVSYNVTLKNGERLTGFL